MIDILYVSHNRFDYARWSMLALLENTDWTEVSGLYIADDKSTDGTSEWIAGHPLSGLREAEVEVHYNLGRFGGPVAAMNWYLDHKSEDADRFAKIDSDFIVCPGWLPELLRQMTLNPGFDVFGLQPRFGPALAPPCLHRTIEEARFIGGIGAIRHRIFEKCRPIPHGGGGRHGWTEFQEAHPFKKAWVTPDLPVFCMDLLPFEPWLSIAQGYIDKGWMRPWSKYGGDGSHWAWWTPCA